MLGKLVDGKAAVGWRDNEWDDGVPTSVALLLANETPLGLPVCFDDGGAASRTASAQVCEVPARVSSENFGVVPRVCVIDLVDIPACIDRKVYSDTVLPSSNAWRVGPRIDGKRGLLVDIGASRPLI